MAKRPTQTSTRATSDGFTLVELTLVVLIVGILASIALPRLTILAGERLDSSARRLATLVSYLHDEAALRGRIYRLTLDLDESAYRIDEWSPYEQPTEAREPTNAPLPSPPLRFGGGAAANSEAARAALDARFAKTWDPYAVNRRLPEGVRLMRVATAESVETSGAKVVYFLPEGSLEDVTIVLVGESGRAVELRLDGVTGHVDVGEPSHAS